MVKSTNVPAKPAAAKKTKKPTKPKKAGAAKKSVGRLEIAIGGVTQKSALGRPFNVTVEEDPDGCIFVRLERMGQNGTSVIVFVPKDGDQAQVRLGSDNFDHHALVALSDELKGMRAKVRELEEGLIAKALENDELRETQRAQAELATKFENHANRLRGTLERTGQENLRLENELAAARDQMSASDAEVRCLKVELAKAKVPTPTPVVASTKKVESKADKPVSTKTTKRTGKKPLDISVFDGVGHVTSTLRALRKVVVKVGDTDVPIKTWRQWGQLSKEARKALFAQFKGKEFAAERSEFKEMDAYYQALKAEEEKENA